MRLRIITVAIVAVMLSTLPVKAEEKKEMSFHVGLYTYHFDSENANNFNRLLGFSYDNWTVAWFKNSYYDETIFAGRAFRTKKLEDKEDGWFLRGGVYVGLVYGYGDNLPTNVGGFSPFLLPIGEAGYGKISFELGVVPLPGSAGLVTGMLKYTF